MLRTTRAIVLRQFKYGETSLIVELYTEQLGVRKYIISGVRSPKSRTKANLLQVMSMVEVVAYEREDRDLNRLKEVRPAYVFQGIPFDVRKGAVGLFMIEVVRKAIRERESNRGLFAFLWERFAGLDRTPHPVGQYHLCFLLELTTFLGFAPAGHFTPSTPFFDLREGEFLSQPPGHNEYLTEDLAARLEQLLTIAAPDSHSVKLGREERRQLLKGILDFYYLHLEGMAAVQAHLILQEIF
ncbi:MAG: DNA repair protein RecO [Lewinella sp.]|nr:DNA repair protein RecO [Lewinella sp.]